MTKVTLKPCCHQKSCTWNLLAEQSAIQICNLNLQSIYHKFHFTVWTYVTKFLQ